MAKQIKVKDNGPRAEDPTDIVRFVARRLQEARMSAGLTQVQLGEKAGLKQSYIFELEYGTTNITVRTLEKMAKALDLDMRGLLPGSPLAPPSASDIQNVLQRLDLLVNVAEDLLKGFVDFRSSVRAFGDSAKINESDEEGRVTKA